MTTRTWIRRLFDRKPRTNRKTAARRRPVVETLEDRLVPTVQLLNNFGGMVGQAAPDACGGAGPDSYVESVNQSVAIYNKSGHTIATSKTVDFFFNVGGYQVPLGQSLGGVSSCYDAAIGRFVVTELQYGGTTLASPSYLDICVSRSDNPGSLTAFDWGFYQIQTSEGSYFSDNPGNIGYNADALVVTFNMIDGSGQSQFEHTQVDAFSQADLKAAGNSLHYHQFDLTGGDLDDTSNFRPVTMNDAVAGGPMWFVHDSYAGNSTYPATIELVRSDNILGSTAVQTFQITVNNYADPNDPLNPDGTPIVDPSHLPLGTNILNAAEANNTIVACQNVGVGSNEDDARWYEFNVSNINSPALVDQGNVGFGPNTYTVYPAIDINEAGDIGMTFDSSGTDTPTDYLSAYVIGRTPADDAAHPGQMENTSVCTRAGNSDDTQGLMGAFSGINVASDGSFWVANEWSSSGKSGTEITHFEMTDTGQAYISNGVLEVFGSALSNNVTLQPKPGDSTQTQAVDNGLVLGNFANSSFSSIDVSLLTGNNTNNSLTLTGGRSGLGFFAVPITYEGGPGENILSLDDSTSGGAHTYTLTGNTVSRDGFGGVTFTNVTSVDLADGTGTNNVNVLSASYGLTLDINGQNDAVTVGSNGSALGGNVQGITGGMYIWGSGSAYLTVDDSGDTSGQTAMLSDDLITGLAPAVIQWVPTNSATGGVIGLNVYGGSGGNTFNVTGTSNFYIDTTLGTGTGTR
jgi:hypothetical protein